MAQQKEEFQLLKLGVDLWACPIPMDYDQDVDFDLLVSSQSTFSTQIFKIIKEIRMVSISSFPMKKLLTVLMVSFISLHAIYSQQNAIVQSSILFPLQKKHCHGSSLVALPNGDYLAV